MAARRAAALAGGGPGVSQAGAWYRIAWQACFAGLLAGGLLGSLAADSGPRVLLIMLAGAACVLAYLQGGPGTEPCATDRSYAALSGALDTEVRVRRPQPDPSKLARR